MCHEQATTAATNEPTRPVNWTPAPPCKTKLKQVLVNTSTLLRKPWYLIFGNAGTIKVPSEKGGNPYPYPLFPVVSTFLLDPLPLNHQLILRSTTSRRRIPRFNITHSLRLYIFNTMAVFGSFRKWLALKQYQLEVTFSVYMFTPWEKFFFSKSLFTFRGLPGILIFRLRLYRFPSLQLDLYRRLPLPPPSHLLPRRSRMVLHERRAD